MIKRILFSLLLLAPFFASAQTNDFKWIKQQTYTATGTDTYAATVSGVTAYTIGLEVKILFTNANTGPATLNINSLGAKTLRKNGSSSLASGDLAAGATYRLTYDGTYLQVLGLGGAGGGSMVYPGAGIPLSTGSAWGTSITDNSANWNTAFGWGNHADRYIKKYGNTYLGTSVNMIADSLYSAFSLRVGAVDTAYSQLNMYKNLAGDVGFSIVSQNNITGEGTLFDNSPTGSSIASSGAIVFNGNGATITLNGAGIQFEDPTISENNGSIYIRQGGYVKPLPIGSANQVLTVSGSAPVWSTPTVYGDMFLGTSQTVTAAKTFNTGTFSLRNPANTFSYNFLGSAIVANRTVTLPLLTGNDEFVMLSHTQNLVNKTFELSQNVLTGLKADFNTAVSDGDFLYVGDVTTNATHTGEVTGSGALTVDKTAITNKTLVTASGSDYVLIADASDSDNLKKVLVSDFGGGSPLLNTIGAATGTNAIDNADYAQTWNWNSLQTSGMSFRSNTTAAQNGQNVLYAKLEGANASSSVTSRAAYFENIHTGTGSINIAQTLNASGGSTNIALEILSGRIDLSDGVDFTFGNTTGTKFGTSTSTKLGFYNATPVVRQSAVTTAQGIADALTAYGLLPTSTISGGSGLTYSQTKAIAMKIR